MGNNFLFDITAEGKELFDIVMKIAFRGFMEKKAVGYAIDKKYGLILYWAEKYVDTKYSNFPFPMTCEAATHFAWAYLEQVEYEPQPDHDGDNEKGWRVYNEDCGHINHQWQAFVAIKPEWQMYRK